jgi:hypothetical protein
MINIGQVEFIRAIFKKNVKLCNDPKNEDYLNFIAGLIKKHGHYVDFLEIFSDFLECTKSDSIEIQKKLLNIMLEENQVIDADNDDFRGSSLNVMNYYIFNKFKNKK